MFRKSKRKIVFSVMLFLILFLAITLGTIYGSAYFSLKKQNADMLAHYVTLYSLDALPQMGFPTGSPGENDLPLNFGSEGGPDSQTSSESTLPGDTDIPTPDTAIYQLTTFYSVAIDPEGEVLATDVGTQETYSAAEIKTMADAVLSLGKTSGTYGHMLYAIDERDEYTLVAFVDATLTENNMDMFLRNTLVAGAIAILVFAAIAMLLAGWIIRPLEENDRKQRQFVSDAEHELKTPVSVIEANVEVLSRELGENRWLENIHYENERMADLIRELLALSHVENREVTMEEIDLSYLVRQETLPFESVAFEQGMTITTFIEENVRVWGNARRLGQMIAILIDNAISHGPKDDEVTVKLTRTRRMALIAVTNRGEAIAEEDRQRLFDRFYRCDTARVGDSRHFGLGLSIARAIIKSHHGNIRVDCPDGKVVFTVSLPLKN